VIAIAIALLVRYDPYNYGEGISTTTITKQCADYVSTLPNSIQTCVSFINNYLPCYHPKIKLITKFPDLLEHFRNFEKFVLSEEIQQARESQKAEQADKDYIAKAEVSYPILEKIFMNYRQK